MVESRNEDRKLGTKARTPAGQRSARQFYAKRQFNVSTSRSKPPDASATRCSADWQSAVSPVGNRPAARSLESANDRSAIQQVVGLRYELGIQNPKTRSRRPKAGD